jgi:hypothetical protein|tara:strand:- start:33 stop:563 length:531 start_codon:yes stop_codon:yes gene_type:complete
MRLFKDLALVLGLLVMTVATIVGIFGYALDIREIRSETIKWGLTWNDLIFIVLAVAFWIVTFKLLWRLRKESGASKLRCAKALLWKTAAVALDFLQNTPINEAAAKEWLPSAPAALERVWSQYQAMRLKDQIDGFLNPDVQVAGNRVEHALRASAGQLNAFAEQLTQERLNPDFRP